MRSLLFSLFLLLSFLRISNLAAGVLVHSQMCSVRITKVLQATVMRGMPHLEEILANTKDPDQVQLYAHSGFHLACEYQVEVNGKNYSSYDESWASEHDDASKRCRDKFTAIREKIITDTKNCQELNGLKAFP